MIYVRVAKEIMHFWFHCPIYRTSIFASFICLDNLQVKSSLFNRISSIDSGILKFSLLSWAFLGVCQL